MTAQRQTNCPNCNYPDESSGYHYRGRYVRGKKCAGCHYTEVEAVSVSEPQVTQRCTIRVDGGLEFLVIVERTNPEQPNYKFFSKNGESVKPADPERVQRKILSYYADEEWKRWLKLT